VTAPVAAGRVLPTLNEDGTRRWLRPRPSAGKFAARRKIVAWLLMALFISLPHLSFNDRPLVLLNVPRREFTLFGTTFLPTETLLFMLLLASVLITIFLLTALFGRVWCGWACPQTVYMEFVFRPIERFFEGGRSGSTILDKAGLRGQMSPRRVAKYATYLLLSLALAHTFLAYFVGVEQLAVWIRRSPFEHPTSFAIMAVTTAGIMFDFTWFREQTCLVACPYGRWQAALLDRHSLIVAYDRNRGEPRHKGKVKDAGAGDCIDCGACVLTCPTGIDIRDGLQMECIHCTQCIDACDTVMDKIGRPRGLIRYSTRAALEGTPVKKLRPRVVLYPLALAVTLGGLITALGARTSAEVTLLRGLGDPYTVEADGTIANQLRVKISNRSDENQSYSIRVTGAELGQVVIPQNPFPVSAGASEMTTLFVLLPHSSFTTGEHPVRILVEGRDGFSVELDYRLLGPRNRTSQMRDSMNFRRGN
jgi:cytochrome c oxidase accessory protein FixG